MMNQSNQNNNNANKATDDKNLVQNIQETVGGALDNAREFVHNQTKSQEQKEAEKPLGQKLDEALPNSAEEAGKTVGQKIDEWNHKIEEMAEEANKKDSEQK